MKGAKETWVIDFGVNLPIEKAKQYESPFKYVLDVVYLERKDRNEKRQRDFWWLHARPSPRYREIIANQNRYITSPAVSKHRIFVWLDSTVLVDHACLVFAREDDYFFGVLHSRLHELWALRQGTWLGVGNDPRYTPTTTFETFPFPWSPGHEDTASTAYQAVAAAAKQLHEERQAWLTPAPTTPPPTPPQNTGRGVKDRTLTHLYNALNVLKGSETMKVKEDAAAFAPRLRELHTTLDRAVCDAYGWPHDILDNDDEILKGFLVFNLQRAAQ